MHLVCQNGKGTDAPEVTLIAGPWDFHLSILLFKTMNICSINILIIPPGAFLEVHEWSRGCKVDTSLR